MYIVQNAFRNVVRNRGRNILIGIIILVIIMATVIALMINDTTGSIIDDYKGRFGSEVQLVVNMQRLREQASANATEGRIRMIRPAIGAEQYMAFGESLYLQGAVYTATVGVNSTDMKAVDEETDSGSQQRPGIGSAIVEFDIRYNLRMLGNQFSDFTEGVREIISGRMPEAVGEVIISKDLADLNNLSEGSAVTFIGAQVDENGESHEILYHTNIVGIFDDITDDYDSTDQRNPFRNRRNEILTTYETIVAPLIPGMSGISVSATYYLKNPDLLAAFAAELYAKGLDPVYDVTTDTAGYNRIVGPVEGLKGISLTFMMVVLLFGGVIIALLSSVAIRERKYEIGVLRAMGMKKGRVALGLWTEMLMISCICLIIGLAAGTLLAQPVTNVMLERQIKAAEVSEESLIPGRGTRMMMGGFFSQSAANTAKPLENIEITLETMTIMQIAGIALLLATFAGLVSISQITKYEPMKILMERN